MNASDLTGFVTIYAMRGLPRSGKSTIVDRLSKELKCPIVNRDAIRLALHGKAFLKSKEPAVATIAKNMVRALAISGHRNIIIDECHIDWPKSMEKLSTIMKGTGITVNVKAIHVDTPIEVCIERAKATGQKRLIPIIESMAKGWKD